MSLHDTKCQNCAAIRDENAELRHELGMRQRGGDMAKVMEAFGLGPTAARLVLILAAARGIPVSIEALIQRMGMSDNSVRVCVVRLRRAAPEVEIKAAYGVGYSLTPAARGIVQIALDGQS